MAITYCNTTTDLMRVYRDIETYHSLKELVGANFSSYSGNIYQSANTGYINQLYEDNVRLLEVKGLGTTTEITANNTALADWGSENSSIANYSATNGAVASESGTVQTGSYSAKFTVTTGGTASAFLDPSGYTLVDAEYYKVSIWYYTTADIDKIYIRHGSNGTGDSIAEFEIIKSAWTNIKGNILVDSSNNAPTTIQIAFTAADDSAVIYFDNYSVKQSVIDASSEWYYDTNNDILYVNCSDDAAPSTHTMEAGVDWDDVKDFARNDAQEMLEGWLRSVYAVPFQKVVAPTESYNSRDYDYWITRATALLTCYIIIQQTNPEDPAAAMLYKQVFHEPTFEGEQPGIVQQILNGQISLRTQRTGREAGGYNVYENPDNVSTAYVIVTGRYTGSDKEVWRVQIDTAGAPGTATYKLSYDQGGTFDHTLQETRDSDGDSRRVSLDGGIYIEFVGTFASGDYWDIELFPADDARTIQTYGTIGLRY